MNRIGGLIFYALPGPTTAQPSMVIQSQILVYLNVCYLAYLLVDVLTRFYNSVGKVCRGRT